MSQSGYILALPAICDAAPSAAPSGNTLSSLEYFYSNSGNDMLGSTLGVKGQQNARISMTAFGSVRRTAESAAQAPADAYGAEPDAYFTGKPQIDELGYAFLFRNYRPEQGKWQTQDPLGYPDGWNNFAYGDNRIFSGVDAQGTDWVLVSGTFPDSETERLLRSEKGSFNYGFSIPGIPIVLHEQDGGEYTRNFYSQLVRRITDIENTYSNPNGPEKGDTWTREFTYSQGTYLWDVLLMSYDTGSFDGAHIENHTSEHTLSGVLSVNNKATLVYVWE